MANFNYDIIYVSEKKLHIDRQFAVRLNSNH